MLLVAGSALAQDRPIINQDIRLPLVIDGKKVGEVAIKAGTPVTVSERKGGKAFVKNGTAEGWVNTTVFVGEEPTPTPTPTPTPASTPEPTLKPATTLAPAAYPQPAAVSTSAARVVDRGWWSALDLGSIIFITLVALLLIYMLKKAFFTRRKMTLTELMAAQETERQKRMPLINAIAQQVLERMPPEHVKTLARKRKILRTVDDYGAVDTTAWDKELRAYFDKYLLNELRRFAQEDKGEAGSFVTKSLSGAVSKVYFTVEMLDGFDTVIESRVGGKEVPTNPYEYEAHCAELLENDGWKARRTTGSGDQGADVIAEKDGTTVVVQCKLYGQPVGNKAVQEVSAARLFYEVDHAVVVTNQTYTPSAKKLANATGVILMHHDDLADLPEMLDDLI